MTRFKFETVLSNHRPARPKHLVVFVHGYGANGHDLISLESEFAPFFEDPLFLSPHAPYPCELGGGGRQWFSLASHDPHFMYRGAYETAPLFHDYLDGLLDHYGLSDENLTLIGFSQGTMMSLFAGLQRAKPLHAIIAYSGIFLNLEDYSKTIKSNPPVLMIHGMEDDVVPYFAFEMSRKSLESLGHSLTAHGISGLGHGIDERCLQKSREFLEMIG